MKHVLLLHKLTRTSPEVYLIADQGSELVNRSSPIQEKLDRFPLRSRMGPTTKSARSGHAPRIEGVTETAIEHVPETKCSTSW
ncbi:hypothetical protein HanPSC8_Chr12g0502061 [Helianthus annuus]|nr:hypothetical protein HanPSC8_Chr12g0502061 [Helianthus annuus]